MNLNIRNYLIFCVEKLQWAPAPFQSPSMGLGSNVTTTPKSSATLSRMYLAIYRVYSCSIPNQGFSASAFFMILRHSFLWLVAMGSMSQL